MSQHEHRGKNKKDHVIGNTNRNEGIVVLVYCSSSAKQLMRFATDHSEYFLKPCVLSLFLYFEALFLAVGLSSIVEFMSAVHSSAPNRRCVV